MAPNDVQLVALTEPRPGSARRHSHGLRSQWTPVRAGTGAVRRILKPERARGESLGHTEELHSQRSTRVAEISAHSTTRDVAACSIAGARMTARESRAERSRAGVRARFYTDTRVRAEQRARTCPRGFCEDRYPGQKRRGDDHYSELADFFFAWQGRPAVPRRFGHRGRYGETERGLRECVCEITDCSIRSGWIACGGRARCAGFSIAQPGGRCPWRRSAASQAKQPIDFDAIVCRKEEADLREPWRSLRPRLGADQVQRTVGNFASQLLVELSTRNSNSA